MNLERGKIVSSRIDGNWFSFYSKEEIKKVGIEINSLETFTAGSVPAQGGLYDPRMGPYEQDSNCQTCGHFMESCPGHFGYIRLHTPVYHPLLFRNLLELLNISCLNCHSIRVKPAYLEGLMRRIAENEKKEGSENSSSLLEARLALFTELIQTGRASKFCPTCKNPVVKFKKEKGYKIVKKSSEGLLLMSPQVLRKAMKSIFAANYELLKKLLRSPQSSSDPSCEVSAEAYFIKYFIVTPPRFRQPRRTSGSASEEAPENKAIKKILIFNQSLGAAHPKRFDYSLNNLQIAVAEVIVGIDDPKATPGIKQVIEKKEGLFRRNMMGKRVNYCARSVISPDPYINTNEIGLPVFFAKRLTFPQTVTAWNYKQLAQMIINGPDEWPGATMIEDRGRRIMLKGGKQFLDQRKALSKTLLSDDFSSQSSQKIVYRHALTGDVVVINRQPTLHKPSMMGHKVKVLLKHNVLRMHYANCKTFNADFDGDEMNIHYPQTYHARAEIENIMFSDLQYNVPTNGSPLRGLIQDHVVSGVLLTKKDSFFSKKDFQQLVYIACEGINTDLPIATPCPAILFPKPLWTGKQVISTFLNHLTAKNEIAINLDSKAAVAPSFWGPGYEEEGMVLIRNNNLLTGVLDKNQFGSSSFGLVHSCFELIGPEAAGTVLSSFGRLFTGFLQTHGFTCGIDDMLLQKEFADRRRQKLREANNLSLTAARKFLIGDDDSIKDIIMKMSPEKIRDRMRIQLRSANDFTKLDNYMKAELHALTSNINSDCLPKGQVKRFPFNCVSLMTNSGAKGSKVNFNQMSCLLGQQELEGKRVPVMISGRTLPCFEPYSFQARAGGFIGDRFLTGIRPQEYFFHCMAGREGLIDTAVKTSNSGYLQRCIIKNLEGISVQYDHTARDSDSSVVQFIYGEDGIDCTNAAYLHRFEFLAQNFFNLSKKYGFTDQTDALRYFDTTSVSQYKSNPSNTDPVMTHVSPGYGLGSVSQLFQDNLDAFLKNDPLKLFDNDDLIDASKLEDKIKKLTKLQAKAKKDPKLQKKAHDLRLRIFKTRNRLANGLVTKDVFANMMHVNYMRNLSNPGEAVGVIAGQSIGEPSTQMTLNTFHLAGHGAANVTLGIPRLREIIMSAAREPSTPSMSLPIRQDVKDPEATAKLVQRHFQRVLLFDTLEEISVAESVEIKNNLKVRVYGVTLQLRPASDLESLNTSFDEIYQYLITSFVPSLLSDIGKEVRRRGSSKAIWSSSISSETDSLFTDNEKPRNTRSNEDEVDSVAASKMNNKTEKATYEATESDAEEDDEDVSEKKKTSKKKKTSTKTSAVTKKEKTKKSTDETDEDIEEEDDDVPAAIRDIDQAQDDSEDDEEVVDKKKKTKKSSSTLKKEASKQKTMLDDNDEEDDPEEAMLRLSNQSSNSDSENVTPNKPRAPAFKSSIGKNYSFVSHPESNSFQLDITFPIDESKFLMLNFVEVKAKDPRSVIRFVPKVTNSFVLKDPKLAVMTEGVNFKEVWALAEHIDVYKAYSTDIYAVLMTFGVEAARACIVKEISSVFGAYGINVDFRHLSLIADYMTSQGGFRSMSRTGMRTNPSVWQKASFETSTDFLLKSSLFCHYDSMTSPSSCIVVGRPTPNGTGAFEVLQPFDYS
eukprot:TRINITY_DN628_c0_g1_i1.p1 TRINITY_DN628_c0_g1~~TRINITY_DN628_c0_g1_i1.p1  ORF type:complete len:1668 (+),score=880.80 TRINITY_DN628_c0_g1_i1:115-5004(+)